MGIHITSKPKALQTHCGVHILRCSCSPTICHCPLTKHRHPALPSLCPHCLQPHTPQCPAAQHHSSTTRFTCFLHLLHTKNDKQKILVQILLIPIRSGDEKSRMSAEHCESPGRQESYIRVTNTKYSGRDQQQEDFIWF